MRPKLRDAAQRRCLGTLRLGRYSLRLSPVQTQATKDTVMLQWITLQLASQKKHPHSLPTPTAQRDGNLTFHTYQGRPPAQRSLLEVPL